MICITCHRDTLSLVPNGSGLMEPLCDECRVKPGQLAQGTQPGTNTFAAVAAERAELHRELEVQTAKAEAVLDCLRVLVQQWRKEMRRGYATPEMQWALRHAEQIIGGRK